LYSGAMIRLGEPSSEVLGTNDSVVLFRLDLSSTSATQKGQQSIIRMPQGLAGFDSIIRGRF